MGELSQTPWTRFTRSTTLHLATCSTSSMSASWKRQRLLLRPAVRLSEWSRVLLMNSMQMRGFIWPQLFFGLLTHRMENGHQNCVQMSGK